MVAWRLGLGRALVAAAMFWMAGCGATGDSLPPEDASLDEGASINRDAVVEEDADVIDDVIEDVIDDVASDRPRDAGRDVRDVATTDAGAADADEVALSDAADVDDAAPTDLGDLDATVDAGPMDTGPVDAGPMDTGPVDAGSADGGVVTCTASSQCDDRISCTTDTCRSGVCVHSPSSLSCPTGAVCDPRRGCVLGASCTSDSQCTDSDPCTDEYCSFSYGVCRYYLRDDDYDGFSPAACGGGDCDDSDYEVFPGGAEVCNGHDDDCDGLVDEDAGGGLCGAGGVCTGGSCRCVASGTAYCGGRCVDVTSNTSHCGACYAACGSSATCAAGRCVCAAGRTSCGSSCVDTATDRFNCGACGNYCGLNGGCSGGACACAAGYTRCSGSCYDLQSDYDNCGACGARCRSDQACRSGRCECYSGETECGGACVDLSYSETNCGACGNACPTGGGVVCLSGRCGCFSGQVLCGSGVSSRCVATSSDPANCGACGNACVSGARCTSGRCECPASAPVTCGGRCVATSSDPANCGACGTVCAAPSQATPTCVSGACRWSCASGRGDCDGNTANGCETDVTTSAAHCGQCGRACPGGAACSLGACPGETWTRSVGGTGPDLATAVATDTSGNVFVAGEVASGARAGSDPLAGSGGGFVVALGPTGAFRWGRAIGGGASIDVYDVDVDAASNVYVVGRFSGTADFGGGAVTSASDDGFVASYTGAGAFRWAQRVGGSGADYAYGLGVDPAGNLVVAGTFTGTADFGGGALTADGTDGYTLALTSTGAFRWAAQLGGAASQALRDVDIDAAGNVVVVGHFQYTGQVGSVSIVSAGLYDVVALGLSATGALRWAQRFGGDDDDLAFGVAVDASGGAYFAGRHASTAFPIGTTTLPRSGSEDAYVAALDASGAPRWARRLGGSGADGAIHVALDGAGNLGVCGWFEGSVDFGGGAVSGNGRYDGFLATFSTVNAFRSARSVGATDDDETHGVAFIGGGPVVAGSFRGAASFGAGLSVTSAGSSDAFVARLPP